VNALNFINIFYTIDMINTILTDTIFLYFLLTVAFFVIVSVPLFQYIRKKRRDIFEPVYLLTLTFLLQYWVKSVEAMTIGDAYLGTPPFSEELIKILSIAWIYLILAFTLFLFAYYSKIGVAVANLFPPLRFQWSVKKSYFVVVILLLISVMAYVMLFEKLGGWHTYLTEKYFTLTTLGTSYLYFFTSFASIALIISYVYLREFGRYRFAIFPIVLIFLVIAITSGTRSALLTPLISLLVIRQYLARKNNSIIKKLKNWKIIIVVCLFILIVFPVILAMRYKPLGEIIKNPLTVYSDLSYLYFSIIGHYQSIAPFVNIIRDTPNVMDYQYGKTYLSALTQWIPRQIWENKPSSFAMVFTDTYFDGFYSRNKTIISPTVLGEAYINFHVGGIVVVALISGILWRAIYQYFVIRNRNTLSSIFIFSILLPFTLIYWEGFLGAIYLPMATLIVGIITSVALKRRQ